MDPSTNKWTIIFLLFAIVGCPLMDVDGIFVYSSNIDQFHDLKTNFNVSNSSPRIDLQIEGVDPPSLDDVVFTEPTWKSLTTVKSDFLPVVFNLTGCSDQDSPFTASGQSWKDLSFQVIIRIDGGQEESAFEGSGIASFGYSFDVSEIPKDQEGIFTITVTVTDMEGSTTTKVYKARVFHDVLDPAPSSGVSKWQIFYYGYVLLLFLGIIIFISLILVNYFKTKKEKEIKNNKEKNKIGEQRKKPIEKI